MSKKVVAVSSVGGHWTELLRLRSAFDGYETIYITTNHEYRSMVGGSSFYSIRDFNRKNPWVLAVVIFRLLSIFLRERPDCIISTGAAPGLTALFVGRVLGIRTVWVESIANVDELSMSGRVASYIAHRAYVQWPELAGPRLRYAGSILG